MSGWLFHRIGKQVEKLKHQTKCTRCDLYFQKNLSECNHCSHLADSELAALISQRKNFRMSLGKAMLFGAVLFLLATFFLAKIFNST